MEYGGSYGGWQPNINSPILNVMQQTYEELFGKKPSVKVMHAGAESESVTPFSAFGGITEITGGRCTVGFFKNGLILLANKDW